MISRVLSRLGMGCLSILLLILFVVLAVIPALVLTGFAAFTEQRDERESVITQLEAYAESGEEALTTWENRTVNVLLLDATGQNPDAQTQIQGALEAPGPLR